MQHKNKTIGVLGGMGPAASANLYQEILKYAQFKYNATQDNDYPPIIIYSLPMEGFDETGIADANLVKQQLIAGVKKLEAAGCDLVIIACNTVHFFYEEIQSAIKIPIFNIIEATLQKVKVYDYKKVGLFSSESTNDLKLYQKAFAQENVEVISASAAQQKILNGVIENVMGGRQGADDVILLKDIARDFIKQGAEAIVMGCTEIPLAINQTQTDIKLFNTIKIIVESAVDYSLSGKLS
ncbi:MAG: amino acid racemase [Candidatus Gracilibacteria bacterium]|nr:amino acid racemase [Candidatus Gracilibacteria bacterium]MDD5179322.1 amino acid racemase [Candidatus Gracilibacteria bacterium]